MTNFEKIKNMTQDEAIEYIKYAICVAYGTCLNCPMKIGRYCKCSTDIFADWLKTEALKTETKD